MSYYIASTAMFNTSSLSPKAFKLITFLQQHANNKTRSSFWRRDKIAQLCSFSLSSFSRALRELKQANLVAVRERYDYSGRQKSNEYTLIENNAQKEALTTHICCLPGDNIVSQSDTQTSQKQASKASQPMFKCPAHALELSGNVLKVYLYLVKRCGIDTKYAVGKKDIAKNCGISLVTVWRCIMQLRKKGLIKVKSQTRIDLFGNNGCTYNLYTVVSTIKDKPTRKRTLFSTFKRFLKRSVLKIYTAFKAKLSQINGGFKIRGSSDKSFRRITSNKLGSWVLQALEKVNRQC